MPRRAKTERKHQKINQTQKQPYVCFCFPRSFFNRVPLGYAGFFFRIFWDFACLPRNAKNMEETKKTIPALCSNGSCSSVLFVFCSQPFFFLFFLHGCQEEPNTAKIPKDQIIQNSYGSYIFLRSCKSEKFLADANNGVLRAHSAIV